MADNNGKFPPMSDAMGMKLIAERKANAKANESARAEGAGKQSAAKARQLAARMAAGNREKLTKPKPAKPAGSFSVEDYNKMKKNGTFKGFDGMNGVSGKGVKG